MTSSRLAVCSRANGLASLGLMFMRISHETAYLSQSLTMMG